MLGSIFSVTFSTIWFWIFYFEITVKKLETYILFGLADKLKKNALVKEFFKIEGTYAYHHNFGNFYINGRNGNAHYKNEFGVGDVIGCGVNLATRQIFFTKNGRPLQFFDLLDDPSPAFDQLFPFVALFCTGDEITANFGSDEFKFNPNTHF